MARGSGTHRAPRYAMLRPASQRPPDRPRDSKASFYSAEDVFRLPQRLHSRRAYWSSHPPRPPTGPSRRCGAARPPPGNCRRPLPWKTACANLRAHASSPRPIGDRLGPHRPPPRRRPPARSRGSACDRLPGQPRPPAHGLGGADRLFARCAATAARAANDYSSRGSGACDRLPGQPRPPRARPRRRLAR